MARRTDYEIYMVFGLRGEEIKQTQASRGKTLDRNDGVGGLAATDRHAGARLGDVVQNKRTSRQRADGAVTRPDLEADRARKQQHGEVMR